MVDGSVSATRDFCRGAVDQPGQVGERIGQQQLRRRWLAWQVEDGKEGSEPVNGVGAGVVSL